MIIPFWWMKLWHSSVTIRVLCLDQIPILTLDLILLQALILDLLKSSIQIVISIVTTATRKVMWDILVTSFMVTLMIGRVREDSLDWLLKIILQELLLVIINLCSLLRELATIHIEALISGQLRVVSPLMLIFMILCQITMIHRFSNNMFGSGMNDSSSKITEADTWIIDAGASQHMVHNMNMMNQ